MDNVKGILLILTLLFGAATFLFFVQASAAKSQVSDALVLSSVTRDLLRAQKTPCGASPEQFKQLAACVAPLLQEKDFEQDAFRQPKDGSPGYLVVKNDNARTYDAEHLLFYMNRELLQAGCAVPGDVGRDVTCRFEFSAECEEGGILEVFYPAGGEDRRVFLKTC